MNLKDHLQTIIAGAAVIGIVAGGITYFAKASDLELVELRLEQKIASDAILQINQQIWQLEDRHGGKPCAEWESQRDRDQYRMLKLKLETLKKRHEEALKTK